MKKYILLGLLVLLFSFAPVKAQKITLPAECAKILDQRFKGWKPAKVNKDAADWFKKSKYSYAPNLIKGDFDGDAKIDFVVLIQQVIDAKPTNSTIVFMNSAKGYKMLNLEGGDGDYLVFEKKGKKAFDHEQNKTFVYKTDAVTVGIWEKSATSYVWKNGKFIGIVTSD